MRLYELLDGIECENPLPDLEIKGIACDSRALAPGGLFICVRGVRADGHQFASDAQKRGAAAILCEQDLGLDCQILVPNSRAAYARICANWFGNPQKDLKLIGVTGTNGKTTIVSLIYDILKRLGGKAGIIGTIQSEIGDMVIPARHTTPDPMQLYAMFARMKTAGMDYVVMEASSHALDQERLYGLRFACAVFTNLTQDHLDYHGTMENYYQAKKKLFAMADSAVINLDDAYGKRLAEEIPIPAYTIGVEDKTADFTAHSVEITAQGSRFIVVNGSQLTRAKISTPGNYAVSNALCALAAAVRLGYALEEASKALENCRQVLGRMEVIDAGAPFTIIRDYAHDPDALRQVLKTVKGFAERRILALFGCAGERDREKRKEMGRMVARYSDLAILTSDNPRMEDPMQIINDTLPGFQGTKTPVEVLPDRYEAIRYALENARKGDILLLLGKGHEDYQVLRYGTIYFDERFIVQDILRKLQEQDTI